MSQPKRRHSRSRGRMRRNTKKVAFPTQSRCDECGAAIQPHTACRRCGTFRGKRQAVKPRQKEKK